MLKKTRFISSAFLTTAILVALCSFSFSAQTDVLAPQTVFKQEETRPLLVIAHDEDDLAARTARIIADNIKEKPNTVLGLATGSTPIKTYKELIKIIKAEDIDLSKVVTFNLDEYCGLAKEHDQSYHYFMYDNLFNDLLYNRKTNRKGIRKKNIHILNGMARNKKKECRMYEQMIHDAGGIDIQILGIGGNGHIGFNEPPSRIDSRTREVSLDESTIKANARFFDNDMTKVPKTALSTGIGTILDAKKIILLATTESKSNAIRDSFEKLPNENVPASFLQKHPDVIFMITPEAGRKLTGYYVKESGLPHDSFVGLNINAGDFAANNRHIVRFFNDVLGVQISSWVEILDLSEKHPEYIGHIAMLIARNKYKDVFHNFSVAEYDTYIAMDDEVDKGMQSPETIYEEKPRELTYSDFKEYVTGKKFSESDFISLGKTYEFDVLSREEIDYVIKIPRGIVSEYNFGKQKMAPYEGINPGYLLAKERLGDLVADFSIVEEELPITIDFRVYRAKNTIIQRRMPSLEKKVRELFENGDKKEIIELLRQKIHVDNEILKRGLYLHDNYLKQYGVTLEGKVVLLDAGQLIEDPAQKLNLRAFNFGEGAFNPLKQRFNRRGHAHYFLLYWIKDLAYEFDKGQMGDDITQFYMKESGLPFKHVIDFDISFWSFLEDYEDRIAAFFNKYIFEPQDAISSAKEIYTRYRQTHPQYFNYMVNFVISNKYKEEFFDIAQAEYQLHHPKDIADVAAPVKVKDIFSGVPSVFLPATFVFDLVNELISGRSTYDRDLREDPYQVRQRQEPGTYQ
ncbi:MAG: glucosamine-6-phosphate deaminase [Candidatus Ancaeobacter aquaticus]|nr:glucosamine-6-phosphate deaminase [Candidatus Ancaeobacter aquaticus]